MQSVHDSQVTNFEKLEKSLNKRITLTQNELVVAKQELKTSNEKIAELNFKVSSLEVRNKELSHEKIQLASQIEVLKAKLSLTEESKLRDSKAAISVKQKFAEEITSLKKEKVLVLVKC